MYKPDRNFDTYESNLIPKIIVFSQEVKKGKFACFVTTKISELISCQTTPEKGILQNDNEINKFKIFSLLHADDEQV